MLDLVSIFILPPSWAELERRLHKRAQDSMVEIRNHMAKAKDELSHYAEYQYIIINHDLQDSIDQAYWIVQAERLRCRRQPGLKDFVESLCDSQSD